MNKSWNLRVWCIYIIILFFVLGCSEEQPDVIAIIGDSFITVDEFRDRFHFSPQLADSKNNQVAKRQLLNVMLAEKILAEDAKRAGAEDTDYIQRFSTQFQREAVIEHFWQDEIVSQINISKEELQNAYEYSKKIYVIQYLIYQDEQSASRDYDLMMKEISFEQIAQLNGYQAEAIPSDTILFSGKLPHIEKAVFEMDLNEIHPPIWEGQYFFIIKLVNRIENISGEQGEFEKKRNELEKILKNQKILDKFQEYKANHFIINSYQLDKTIFKKLTQQLENILFDNANTTNQNIKSEFREKLPQLNNSKLNEFRHLKVVKFSEEIEWTVEQLLNRLSIAPYPIDIESKGTFRSSMIAGTKRILDDELIVLHGEKIGLSKNEIVRNQQRIWTDCLIATKELVNVINKGNAKPERKPDKEWLSQYLKDRSNEYEVELNHSILDTLSLNNRADMVVIKKHFPLRSIAPSIPSLWINSDLFMPDN